jgi:hypothetical protein
MFKEFPKIARLNRGMVVTEKLDGTNACVVISEDGSVLAQSRNRMITPEDDNYGFARWVADNSEALVEILGVGYHYGEWWGAGIQRRYGLVGTDKRFSLFNVGRWKDADFSKVEGLGIVPVLYEGLFSQNVIEQIIEYFRAQGSIAVPGFMDPEGVVVWHEAARQLFKITVKDDEKPKGSTEK